MNIIIIIIIKICKKLSWFFLSPVSKLYFSHSVHQKTIFQSRSLWRVCTPLKDVQRNESFPFWKWGKWTISEKNPAFYFFFQYLFFLAHKFFSQHLPLFPPSFLWNPCLGEQLSLLRQGAACFPPVVVVKVTLPRGFFGWVIFNSDQPIHASPAPSLEHSSEQNSNSTWVYFLVTTIFFINLFLRSSFFSLHFPPFCCVFFFFFWNRWSSAVGLRLGARQQL